jgi:hypothetical protein
MNLGIWAAVTALLVKLLSLFRGKGYRADVTIRSEEAIEADRDRLDELYTKLKEKRDEVKTKTKQDCKARKNKLYRYADESILPELLRLQREYRDLRRDFVAAGGHLPPGW